MDGGEDWMMQVIEAGYLPFVALRSVDYDLEDFVFCREAMDVRVENAARQKQINERNKRKK